ncbi:FMN-dependent NADH-azoreductase [Granulosicoccaceae sp. 1_MG-2023]|nr:FMN-dependent NADH-azoreductase [Granulosicoccaceae sp. 1_MG-2023]
MKKILVIHSSPLTQGSKTRELAADFIAAAKAADPQVSVTERDLVKTDLPHIDEALIGAFYTPAEQRTEAQKAALALSDELLAELREHDTIVIGSPMHNFSITSRLKAWIDHISRVGETFVYTETGPKGLLEGKKAYILASRGGNYGPESPAAALNFQDTYLRAALGFVGIDDVTTIVAEGVAQSEDGLAKAKQQINELAA